MIATLANKTLVKNMLTCKTGLLDHFADDGEWIIVGSTRWSGAYRDKSAIGRKLLAPLSAEIENLGAFVIDNIVAEGDFVVVQGHAEGRVTKSGTHYDNTCCLVYRLFDGKVQKLTEYCDTELVTAVFGRSCAVVPCELNTAAS